MVDKKIKEEMLQKIEDGSFGVNDIKEYMDLFVELANESEDVEYEIEGWDRILNFKLENANNFSLVFEDGEITLGNLIENADVTLELDAKIAAGVFTGEIDATSAYMSGDLKIKGALPDAVKFRTIVELVREELEDDW